MPSSEWITVLAEVVQARAAMDGESLTGVDSSCRLDGPADDVASEQVQATKQ
ncbi:MAG: hypothetical protein ACLQU9_09055 [Acidimicrobiales bacterium]